MQKIVENLDAAIAKMISGEDCVLVPRQRVTFEKIRNFLATGNTEGNVTLPTGIGKTVIFSKFLEAALVGSDFRALIVGPSKIILHQNRWKVGEFGNIDAGAYFHHEKDLSHQVTVTTYHSLRRAIKKGLVDPTQFQILILDEAHRALGPETLTAVEAFEKAIKIGFTATPEFHEEKSVADLLPHTIDEMSVREAIESNLLAGLKVYVMTTGVNAGNIATIGNDFEELSLTKALNTPERNKFIARLWFDERFNKKRTVVYAASRAHARALTDAFLAEDVRAAYIDGTTAQDDTVDGENIIPGRDTILSKFKNGEIDVLCNVKVLIEGFDESEAEVCFNATPTLSKVVAEQRGGRILRRSRLKDNKLGMIVEIFDDFGKSSNTPVLFTEIAGAAEILAPSNIDRVKVERKQSQPGSQKEKSAPGEIIDDPQVIMDMTNQNRRWRFTKMFQFAPPGWVYSRKLAHELHVKENEIRAVAEKHLTTEPDGFKRYLTITDILVTHYHPKLVDRVRRTFVNELEGMITPEIFAESNVLSIGRAEQLLEDADKLSSRKAIRFDDVAYFSEKEHVPLVKRVQTREQQLEAELICEAEELFWNDDDRTEETREHDYWNSFEEISSENKGVSMSETELDPDPLLHGDDVVEFDDDTQIPLVQDEPSITLTPQFRKKVRSWINLLPERFRSMLEAAYFSDCETLREIEQKLGKNRGNANHILIHAERFLGRQQRVLYVWEYEGFSDADLFTHARHRYVPNDIYYETQVTPEARKLIDAMRQKFMKQRCYWYRIG